MGFNSGFKGLTSSTVYGGFVCQCKHPPINLIIHLPGTLTIKIQVELGDRNSMHGFRIHHRKQSDVEN